MITTQTNKHTNKQTSKKTNSRNRICNKQTCICIVLIQGNGKNLMKFVAVSKNVETVKCLPKILFNIYFIDLYLLTCFCFLFKIRLESVTKVFMSEVVQANLKISKPIDA